MGELDLKLLNSKLVRPEPLGGTEFWCGFNSKSKNCAGVPEMAKSRCDDSCSLAQFLQDELNTKDPKEIARYCVHSHISSKAAFEEAKKREQVYDDGAEARKNEEELYHGIEAEKKREPLHKYRARLY